MRVQLPLSYLQLMQQVRCGHNSAPDEAVQEDAHEADQSALHIFILNQRMRGRGISVMGSKHKSHNKSPRQ